VSNATRVDVHEVGGRVEPDAAALHCEGGITKPGQRNICQPDVDRLSFHVQAVRRHAFAVLSEHLVGRGRSIPRYHLKRPATVGDGIQIVEEIEQLHVDRVQFVGAEIAQEMVDRVERVAQIRAAAEVFDLEALTGVQMIEAQQTRFGRRCRADPATEGQRGPGRGKRRYELTSGQHCHGYRGLSASGRTRCQEVTVYLTFCMRWYDCSFSRQISSTSSVSTAMRCFSVTVHGFV